MIATKFTGLTKPVETGQFTKRQSFTETLSKGITYATRYEATLNRAIRVLDTEDHIHILTEDGKTIIIT